MGQPKGMGDGPDFNGDLHPAVELLDEHAGRRPDLHSVRTAKRFAVVRHGAGAQAPAVRLQEAESIQYCDGGAAGRLALADAYLIVLAGSAS